ncbi:MAG: hypothetical protein ACE5HV_05770 [Acidobacteriota bacterium]
MAATGISEINLPVGFGIPLKEILSGMEEPWRGLSLLGMVLNNHDPEMNRKVKIRFSIDYISDSDPAASEISSMYKASVPVIPGGEVSGGGFERTAAVVLTGDPLQPSGESLETAHGKEGHWMVLPGRQVIRQRYRHLIGVPTRVHYGLVHMHNHGRSMRLTDVTEGKVLWETELIYEPDRVQIAENPPYSSTEGFLMVPDHEYEIESVYDNTSSVPVDAMAVMYLYHHPLHDERISYPPPRTAAAAPDAQQR